MVGSTAKLTLRRPMRDSSKGGIVCDGGGKGGVDGKDDGGRKGGVCGVGDASDEMVTVRSVVAERMLGSPGLLAPPASGLP